MHVRVLYKSISVFHMCDKCVLFALQTREIRKQFDKRFNPGVVNLQEIGHAVFKVIYRATDKIK